MPLAGEHDCALLRSPDGMWTSNTRMPPRGHVPKPWSSCDSQTDGPTIHLPPWPEYSEEPVAASQRVPLSQRSAHGRKHIDARHEHLRIPSNQNAHAQPSSQSWADDDSQRPRSSHTEHGSHHRSAPRNQCHLPANPSMQRTILLAQVSTGDPARPDQSSPSSARAWNASHILDAAHSRSLGTRCVVRVRHRERSLPYLHQLLPA